MKFDRGVKKGEGRRKMLVVLHVGLITNNPNQKSDQKLKSPQKKKEKTNQKFNYHP
jgi:hypothetical protein